MSYRQYLDYTKLIIENPLAQKHFHLLMGMMNSKMISIKTNWITKLIGERGRERLLGSSSFKISVGKTNPEFQLDIQCIFLVSCLSAFSENFAHKEQVGCKYTTALKFKYVQADLIKLSFIHHLIIHSSKPSTELSA